MEILTGHNRINPATLRVPSRQASSHEPEPEKPPDTVDLSKSPFSETKSALLNSVGNWRDFTLNEAAVEIPQGILQLSNLNFSHPVLGGVAQGGIAALAMVRAVQGLRGESIEQKMEGTSSLALAVAGAVSLFPGSLAASAANVLMMGQGGIELALGVRELHEELSVQNKACWQELVTGSLDVIKGGSAFLPLISSDLNTISNAIQLGALVAKTALETTFVHDSEQKLG